MGENTITVKIEGMRCNHCVCAVQSALEEWEGISRAAVSLEEKSAAVTYDPDRVTTDRIADIIEEEGYTPQLSK